MSRFSLPSSVRDGNIAGVLLHRSDQSGSETEQSLVNFQHVNMISSHGTTDAYAKVRFGHPRVSPRHLAHSVTRMHGKTAYSNTCNSLP